MFHQRDNASWEPQPKELKFLSSTFSSRNCSTDNPQKIGIGTFLTTSKIFWILNAKIVSGWVPVPLKKSNLYFLSLLLPRSVSFRKLFSFRLLSCLYSAAMLP